MEMVVNIWPIVDAASNLIQRFAARAYAMQAEDDTISTTLKALARSDFALAHQFPIPANFTLVTEHGELAGVVTPRVFNQSQARIIENALRRLETDLPPLHGVGIAPNGQPFPQRIPIKFPVAPYFVVTFLKEDAAGNLTISSP